MIREERVSPLGVVGVPTSRGRFDALIVGASFGGPKAVEEIALRLPRDFPLPVVVCQHISSWITGLWCQRLAGDCPLRVVEGRDGMPLEPGSLCIVPSGFQATLSDKRGRLRLNLGAAAADTLFAPSIDGLLSSAAEALGSRALAVLLTGMGNDGAEGMLNVRTAGGYTIGESFLTADSYSMPGAAMDLGAVVEELPRPQIAGRLIELAGIGR